MANSSIGFEGKPLFDIASYARQGISRRDRLSPAEVALIQRTVSRTPEVMVKVLSHGAGTLKAVRGHLAYLNRGGELEIETDEGERLGGDTAEVQLLRDWDLEVEQYRGRAALKPGKDRAPPRLIHKVLFSMPPGTPSKKVLQAVKNFARDEFALKHRYAMVLHTDEPHPHVHLVIKAVSEQGVRLNVRKAMLRRWRADFAAHLRSLGVPANATERAVRGVTKLPMSDGVYRTAQRGESTVMREREARNSGRRTPASLGHKGQETRVAVRRGWSALSELLREDHQYELAARAERFAQQLGVPQPARSPREDLNAREPDAPSR